MGELGAWRAKDRTILTGLAEETRTSMNLSVAMLRQLSFEK